MKRRSFLDVLGLGLPVADGIETDGNGGFPTLSVTADDLPVADVSPSVDVVREFSGSGPARIAVTLTSVSETASGFTFGPTPPFSGYVSAGERGHRLVLVPVADDHRISRTRSAGDPGDASDDRLAEDVPIEEVEGCWTLAGELPPRTETTTMDLSVGKAVRVGREYAVVNHPDNDRCLPRGEYRFATDEYFEDGTTWGFDLAID